MLCIVEVRLIDGDLSTSLSDMRTWLDHRRIEPIAFRHSSSPTGIACYAEFRQEGDAAAFARAFGGRVIPPPAASAATAAGNTGGSGTVSAAPARRLSTSG